MWQLSTASQAPFLVPNPSVAVATAMARHCACPAGASALSGLSKVTANGIGSNCVTSCHRHHVVPTKRGNSFWGGRFCAEPMKEKFKLKKRKTRKGGKTGEQIKEKKLGRTAKKKGGKKSCWQEHVCRAFFHNPQVTKILIYPPAVQLTASCFSDSKWHFIKK